jgi:hypothetical protein
MKNTFKTKTTNNPDVAQGMNAEALRILFNETKSLQVVFFKGKGFKVMGYNNVETMPMDLTEDVCDFTGWQNHDGFIGHKNDFSKDFAKEVIGDFGLILFGDRKKFKFQIIGI